MARRRADVRREEILAATVGVVRRHGFGRTRVGDVAKVLHVSPALVFYHFATKDRLLAAALEYAVERDLTRLDRTLARGADPLDRLRQVLRLYSPQGRAPGWAIWVDAWSAVQRTTSLRPTTRRLDARWRDALTGVITEGVRDQRFRCVDPEASARRLTALMDGLAVQATVHRTLPRAQLARWVAEAAAAEVGVEPDRLR